MMRSHPSRRSTDHGLNQILDSPGLKAIAHLVTVVAIPLFSWGGSQVLGELRNINAHLSRLALSQATAEVRIANTEREVEKLHHRLDRLDGTRQK